MSIDLNNIGMKNSIADITKPPESKVVFKSAENAEDRIKRQKSEFFTLLTTQLQNQDPLSPMDTAEMTNQIFSINNVEQQLNTNKLLEEIKNLFISSHTATDLNYIDKIVEYSGNEVEVQGSHAVFTYNVLENATDGVIKIKDVKGNTVFTEKVDSNTGMHNYTWNKPTDLPDGMYKFYITALKPNDEPASIKTFASGKVRSIMSKDGKQFFEINDKLVPIDDSYRIRSSGSVTDSILTGIQAQLNEIQASLFNKDNVPRAQSAIPPLTAITDPTILEGIKRKLAELNMME